MYEHLNKYHPSLVPSFTKGWECLSPNLQSDWLKVPRCSLFSPTTGEVSLSGYKWRQEVYKSESDRWGSWQDYVYEHMMSIIREEHGHLYDPKQFSEKMSEWMAEKMGHSGALLGLPPADEPPLPRIPWRRGLSTISTRKTSRASLLTSSNR